MLDRATVKRLRAGIAAVEGVTRRFQNRIKLGPERVDEALNGGLVRGSWHELAGEGAEEGLAAAPAAFAARLAAGLADTGEVIWVTARRDLYPPALLLGRRPSFRLVEVRVGDAAQGLSALEEALASPAVGVAIGEVEALTLTAQRRLQLAAQRGGGLGLVIRRRFGGRRLALGGGAAASRWRIASAPSRPLSGQPGLGPPRWRVRLEHCRGGRPGEWLLEANEAQDGAHPFHLVETLADHGLAAEPAPWRRAG